MHTDNRDLDRETPMSAHSSTLGVFAVMVLALPQGKSPYFTLGAHGAINLAVASDEARYGSTPVMVEGSRMTTISLGATRTAGALTLSTAGDRLPGRGRYPIRPWEQRRAGAPQFEALFVAGAPDHPLGAFRGETGWVTITRADSGRVTGEFEIEARGFTAADMGDEDQWVTVRGSFEARGDSTVAAVQSVAASNQ
jgi:hypothetical protein